MTFAARPVVAVVILAGLASFVAVPVTQAAPVEVYREGPQFCPRDRPEGAAVLDEAQAVNRARDLLPKGFCGPDWHVDGCDVITEFDTGSWRVYLHQYKKRGGRHDWAGRTHTYVILDRVGNCLAQIPGTELGANN